jgi:hypothetical protein
VCVGVCVFYELVQGMHASQHNSPAPPPPPLAVGRRVDEAVDVTMLSCGRDGADRDGGGIVAPRSVRGHQPSLPSVVSDAGDRADSAATDG